MSNCNIPTNQIAATNQYIKTENDYEKYIDDASKVYGLIDINVLSLPGDQLIDKITHQKFEASQIGNDLFGDEMDGHIHMNIEDAINTYFDIIRDKINKAPIDESDKNMITKENLIMTCEFVRAFGM